MRSRHLGAVAALAATIALAACSSSTVNGQGQTGNPPAGSSSTGGAPGGGMPTDAAGLGELMQRAVAGVTSAHINLSVQAAGLTINGSGDEKLANGKLVAMDLTETLPGGAGSLELIITNGKVYAKLPPSINPTNKPYVLVTPNSSDSTIRELANSIDSSLSSASVGNVGSFVNAAKSVNVLGHQSVGGVDATHYKVVVDISKLPTDLPGASELTQSGLKTLPLNLYIDSSGRPVQVAEHFSISGQTVDTKVTITNYNQPVTIIAPRPNEIATR